MGQLEAEVGLPDDLFDVLILDFSNNSIRVALDDAKNPNSQNRITLHIISFFFLWSKFLRITLTLTVRSFVP